MEKNFQQGWKKISTEDYTKEDNTKDYTNNIPLISPRGENVTTESSGNLKNDDDVSKSKMELCPFASEDFRETWQMLLQQPKWKKKSLNAIKLSAKKLKKYDEAFAKYIAELAIANDWQGVIFPDTEERYRKWQQSRQAAKPQGIPRFASEADKRAYYEGLLNGTIKRCER